MAGVIVPTYEQTVIENQSRLIRSLRASHRATVDEHAESQERMRQVIASQRRRIDALEAKVAELAGMLSQFDPHAGGKL